MKGYGAWKKFVTVQLSFSAFINLPASCQSLQCSLCLFITKMKGNGAWKKLVTVQPLIYYIRKPASKLSVAAMQLVFTSFHK